MSENWLIQFEKQMMAHGFSQVTDRAGNHIKGLFTRMENPVLYCVYFTAEQEISPILEAYTKTLEGMLPKLQCTHLVRLVMHTYQDLEPLTEAYNETIHSVYWWLDETNQSIVPRKGDPSKLMGIEKLLIQSMSGGKVEKLQLASKDKPFVCIHIWLLCCISFLAMIFWDKEGILIRTFALKRSMILEGELYRFVTAMFLHSGWMHFCSNSIMLYYFGTQMEGILGHKKFLLAYLFCGLTCGLASILWMDVYSLGASGGLFGMMMLVVLYTKKYGTLGRGRMNHATLLIFVIYGLLMGFTNTTTDNLGHIGGLVGGLLVYALLEWKKQKQSSNK